MSKEIKFRLYRKSVKSYIDYTTIGFSSSGELRSYANKNGVGPVLADEYIVEQYTGLKDKNGKEIYEGDILGGMFEGCYISWCDTTKSFELFNCCEHYCMACDGDILWCELSDSDIDLEVIGNIHENPELLPCS